MKTLGARVMRVSSQDGSRKGSAVIDGDTRTCWRTPWAEGGPTYPHELVVEFPNLVVVRGLKLTPIQDANGEGRIKEFAIYASGDREESGDGPVARGSFKASTEPVIVTLEKPTELRMFRFTALSPMNPEQPIAALAEIELIVD